MLRRQKEFNLELLTLDKRLINWMWRVALVSSSPTTDSGFKLSSNVRVVIWSRGVLLQLVLWRPRVKASWGLRELWDASKLMGYFLLTSWWRSPPPLGYLEAAPRHSPAPGLGTGRAQERRPALRDGGERGGTSEDRPTDPEEGQSVRTSCNSWH